MDKVISGSTFPAIRGIQAGNEYYTVMCPLKRLRRLFTFDERSLPATERAQRSINTERIPQITNYMLNERMSYAFSALTACIEGTSIFIPLSEDGHNSKIGTLIIDEDAEVYIADGQHRHAAISEALRQDPSLGDESIAVVFFADKTLQERQKIFKDLNLYPIKVDSSLSLTYADEPHALLSKTVISSSSSLSKLVHMEQSNLGKRSKKLISHSAFNKATRELLGKITPENYQAFVPIALNFWEAVIKKIPAWRLVIQDQVSGGEIREESIHAHSVTFQSLGMVGRWLLQNDDAWEERLEGLSDIDWARSNKADWEGRCVFNGNMRNTRLNAKLTANRIKHHLKIPLSSAEQEEEAKVRETYNGN